MFETVEMAPPDPILGLNDAFNKDPRPGKINLSVGVYKDASGKTPVLEVVKHAERKLLETELTKNYKPIPGDPAYGKLVQELLFGEAHPIVASGRAQTAHTPGGTGALRVAADYLHRTSPKTCLWISEPTWPNHPQIFQAAGLEVKTYPYFDKAANALAFDSMLSTFQQIPAGDVVLLHACCHNPTGVDPAAEQWSQIGQALGQRGVLPLIDFAYQGFASGIDQDAEGLRALCRHVEELLICSSFSKNFGLYNERVGALTVVARSPQAADAVMSQVKVCIRANYSNPPAHGGAVVAAVLGDSGLRAHWQQEVAAMRDRINGMRGLFVESLKKAGAQRDFEFIRRQRGMFSFSGLTREQVEQLRKDDGIYIVGSGRINVAGMTEQNMTPLCSAIARVLSD